MSTLKEVAKKAEVSVTTVSRVINNSNKVSADTRERVQRAMRKLEYKPSRVAQRLRGSKGRSKLLGLIIPDIQNQFYSNIVRGIEDVAYKNKYAVILCNSDENPNKERFYLDVLRSESVDGVILPPIHQYGKVLDECLIEYGIPVVCVDRKLARESVDAVVVNNHKGGYIAVSHLINLGHEQIAIISSSHQFSSFDDRQNGYEQALKDNKLEVNEDLIVEGDPRSSEQAYKLTKKLLEVSPRPSAIFITNNLMTLGALEAINEMNLKIPEDISIVMYDDTPWATAITSPLTVISQPAYEMGRRAAELFLQRIADPGRAAVQVSLEPKLIVRKSTSFARDKNNGQ
ncbi:LacI family transcriptional regulator [Aliifodinibius sp. S!AR15-10]|uniref:LacI family DNA-binding transcriptional regulator n=1 Tax=Aliifodinibius sp. S!AR15-10 TaxID=2950437 RepID=UPI0028576F26|nr:LacI family DNA-binding transcriptional regulator [Aliifodinibius sp. S!AR15-10]MDR8391718.1 LacI family transcriptional regulator [Aliifodinibius sp. S!AR15-10]